ncbi:MAG: hypothetical protein ACRDGT_02270 [Candidatus Limnocylindria bacterium]
MDQHEILVTVKIPEPQGEGDADAARAGRIQQFRESTREERMLIAQEAQQKYGKVLSWGARCGDSAQVFTHLALPIMTRLRIAEREVLDQLVSAGIARSRAHALAWCVALVRKHEADWLQELREAMESVRRVSAQGPKLN